MIRGRGDLDARGVVARADADDVRGDVIARCERDVDVPASREDAEQVVLVEAAVPEGREGASDAVDRHAHAVGADRKSTRLNSSHT